MRLFPNQPPPSKPPMVIPIDQIARPAKAIGVQPADRDLPAAPVDRDRRLVHAIQAIFRADQVRSRFDIVQVPPPLAAAW